MTRIWICDCDAKEIDRLCEKHDISVEYLVELLLEHADEVLEEEGYTA